MELLNLMFCKLRLTGHDPKCPEILGEIENETLES